MNSTTLTRTAHGRSIKVMQDDNHVAVVVMDASGRTVVQISVAERPAGRLVLSGWCGSPYAGSEEHVPLRWAQAPVAPTDVECSGCGTRVHRNYAKTVPGGLHLCWPCATVRDPDAEPL